MDEVSFERFEVAGMMSELVAAVEEPDGA